MFTLREYLRFILLIVVLGVIVGSCSDGGDQDTSFKRPGEGFDQVVAVSNLHA